MSINSHKRRPSDAEEVEAGMALAGLGLGLTVDQVKARRDSMNGFHADETSPKKAKRDKVKKEKEGKEVKEAKDGRKSCSECRRLKAKCDRVFPCSNCELAQLGRASSNSLTRSQVVDEDVLWSVLTAI